MDLLLITVGSLMSIAALVTIVGMTLGDIKAIRIEARLRQHPYSRRFRQRPLLSIVLNDNASDECIEAVKRSSYRKVEIVFYGEEPRGDLMLYLKRDTILEPDAITHAIRQFNNDHKLNAIELLPAFSKPQTVRQLFDLYRHVSLAPFISVRAVFHAVPLWSQWPIMIRKGTRPNTMRLYISRIFRWFALSMNALTLLYVGYIAVVLYEPLFLMMYLSGFCAWMILAIGTYPTFSRMQKVQYVLLAPVAFGYFLYLALKAPFGPFILRLRASISRTFWRSYGQPMA